jgi:sRNA-binding protein
VPTDRALSNIQSRKRLDAYRARIRHLDAFRERVDVPEKHGTSAGGLTAHERPEQWASALEEDETQEFYERRHARQTERPEGKAHREPVGSRRD